MRYEEMFFDYNKQPGQKLKTALALGDGEPLVTIITSYYNSKEYIMQTVNCVLNQTFPFWEWIIVNDGSTQEGTDEFLETIAKIDKRIKIYKKGNEGLAKGRDYAISKSTTEYMLPLDADDLIVDTYVETAYWCLRTNKEATWAFSNSVGFGKYIYLANKKFDSEVMKQDNLLTATALIRKDKILELNGYGVAKRYVNEDWHLWLRMLAKGFYPVQMNFYGFWYRRNEKSLLSEINDKKKEENKLRLRDLKIEADKIKNIVEAKIYPIEDKNEEEQSIQWEGKNFNKEQKKNRILYILPWLTTDENIHRQIINKEKDSDITIITVQPSEYINRQEIEEYAEIFDLSTFLDKKYWKSFIEYIIKTRNATKIYIANNNDIENYLRKNFPEIEQKKIEYIENSNILKRKEEQYKKSRKIYNRIKRKIRNILYEKGCKKK
ncbi:MAG: glycosyltransferase family 2 protein [Clostridia bacterium]|nr:glycosyltransferase family 2 protein [Clostridia bacterium]